jgi:hypothetical protein
MWVFYLLCAFCNKYPYSVHHPDVQSVMHNIMLVLGTVRVPVHYTPPVGCTRAHHTQLSFSRTITVILYAVTSRFLFCLCILSWCDTALCTVVLNYTGNIQLDKTCPFRAQKRKCYSDMSALLLYCYYGMELQLAMGSTVEPMARDK